MEAKACVGWLPVVLHQKNGVVKRIWNVNVAQHLELQRVRMPMRWAAPCRSPRTASSFCLMQGSTGNDVEDLERKHKLVFEDGFTLLPKFWREEEFQGVAKQLREGLLLGAHQARLLERLVAPGVCVLAHHRLLHPPGLHCTDAATSPEPWWDQLWQVEGLEVDECQELHAPSWTATLVVCFSGQSGERKCGGIAVYPRSHWLIHDWILAVAAQKASPSLPQPLDVPAAAPLEPIMNQGVQLELGCGDAALLHPWLAHTVAPNVSSNAADLLIMQLQTPLPNPISSRSGGKDMWRGWHAMVNYVSQGPPSMQTEQDELQEEEVKSWQGGWATSMEAMSSELPSLPFAVTSFVAPRDLLAWQLRTCVDELMKDERWNEAMPMLQRLAGLHPWSYLTVFQAGQCCIRNAPAGQLGGRAGRKSMLEDGERFLLRAIEMAPGWPLAYSELAKSLLLMGRGRELEITDVVVNMRNKCDLEKLCWRYPEASVDLQRSWDMCDAMLSSSNDDQELRS